MLSWRNAFKETILSKSVDWFMRKPLEDDKDKAIKQFKANQIINLNSNEAETEIKKLNG